MMGKNIQRLLLYSCIGLVWLSCKKGTPVTPIPLHYQKLEKVAMLEGLGQLLNEASGSISITNLKPFGSQTEHSATGPSEIQGAFFDDNEKIIFGAIEVENISVTPNEFKRYKSKLIDRNTIQSFFGNTKTVKLYSSSFSNSDLLIEENIYLPEVLYVHQPTNRGGDKRIDHNTTVYWNADPQNVNGVFLLIDFLPGDEENSQLSTTTLSPSYQKLIYTEDTGSYQFKPSDFVNIPSGAYVNLTVGRGDFLEATGGDTQSYILYSFTGATASFYVDE